ncbi:MAG: hypothetical protein WC556_03315 [Candidatus Methanoperedens sp.]
MIKKNSVGFLDSESAISLLLGTVLLLAIMVAVISMIQAQSVPEWNKAVEVEHSDAVYYDFLKIKSSIEEIPVSEFPRSDTVHMGVHYPANLIFLNPPDTSGTLTLKKDTWINVSYTDSSNNRIFFNNSSTHIIFNPNYNYVTNAPLIVYEHGLVIKEFENYMYTDADQNIFSNESLKIPILDSPEESISLSDIKVLNFFPQSITTTTNNSNVSITLYTNYPQLWDVLLNRSNLTSTGLIYTIDGNKITVNYSWNISINIRVVNGSIPPVTPIPIYETTPPASVTNLINATYEPMSINWTWTDPADFDFDHVEVYIDGLPHGTVAKGVQSFNSSYFKPNSSHTISTRTWDTSGNVNAAWVNSTSSTSSLFTYVFDFLIKTNGTVTNEVNAKNASDGGATANLSKVASVGTNGTYNYTNVTSYIRTNGNITNFVNMQNASDTGAFANLTEGQALTNQSDRTINPTKTNTTGMQSGSYTPSNLTSNDGAIDITIPGGVR